MKAFAKVALGVLMVSGSMVAVTGTASALPPTGYCLNMPADETDREERGCNNPRGEDPRFQALGADTSEATDEAAEFQAAVAEPKA